jgi:hypothetical protein
VSFPGMALQRAKHRAITRSRVRQLLYDLLQRSNKRPGADRIF